jgi:hypothetical protein
MSAPRSPKAATLWLYRAVEDYASARCLLLHGLQGGFVLAQQAVEKLLKTYLTVAHPGRSRFVGKGQLVPGHLPVNPSHDLIAHFNCAKDHFTFLSITSEQVKLLENLSYCFEGKYPDSETPLTSTTTAWVNDLDDLFVPLSLELPLDDSIRWRTGIYASAWPIILANQADPPSSQWIRAHNSAFQRAFPQIQQVVLDGSAKTHAPKATA